MLQSVKAGVSSVEDEKGKKKKNDSLVGPHQMTTMTTTKTTMITVLINTFIKIAQRCCKDLHTVSH